MSGFIYPPSNADSVTLTYNYRDTVDVAWATNVDNEAAWLVLYYYLNDQPWALGSNTSIGINATSPVALNILNEQYYAQLNIYVGSSKKYLSCFFFVDYNTTQSPVTWGSSSTTTSSSSVSSSTSSTSSSQSSTSSSASTTTSSSSSSTTSKASTASAASDTSTTTSSSSISPDTVGSAATQLSSASAASTSTSSLSGGAKAGIAIGVIIGVLGLLGLGFFFWRRRRNATPKNAQMIGELPAGENKQAPPAGSYYQPEKAQLNSDPQYTSRTHPNQYVELAENRSMQELPA